MPVLEYPGTPGTTLYAGLPTPGGAVVSAFAMVNTSGSTQAANFVSPMFGVPMKKGEMPAGEYPQFTLDDDTPCPATLWGYTYWSDGSMKFCGAMIRVPTSIAGSGTLDILCKSGGSVPSASGRSTSDLTAADLKTELTGVANLSGLWTASLNTAITDATDIVLIADGPAGKVWRIAGEVKQSGSAHGQLWQWNYVAALQDVSGNLMGLRWLQRVHQPWADVTSPATAVRTMTAVVKSGATTIRTLQGTSAGEAGQANIVMAHWSSFTTPGAEALWDYVQGGGSGAADCTVFVRHAANTDLLRTRTVPAYDTTVTVTNPSAVSYRPYARGEMERNMPGTGERDDIGVLPTWGARWALSQTPNTLRNVRVNAMCSFGWRVGARLKSTRNIIVASTMGTTYTGMGSAQPTWRFPGAGMNNPGTNTSNWIGEEESSHRPTNFYLAYLATGEPQYLDGMMESASSFILNMPNGAVTFKTSLPINGAPTTGSGFGQRDITVQGGSSYPAGAALFYPYSARIGAWLSREISQAAALMPATMPDGSQANAYMVKVAANTFDSMNEYINAMSSNYRAGGIWAFEGTDGNDLSSPWMTGYMCNSLCHQASILDTTNSAAVRNHLSKWISSTHAIADVACLASYRHTNYLDNGNRVDAATDLTYSLGGQLNTITLTYSTASNNITRSGTRGNFTVTNGDQFVFIGGTKPFASATDKKLLYAVNSTGSSFQLSATVGGSPITVTTNGSTTAFYMRGANFTPQFVYDSFDDAAGYAANIYGAARHFHACGDTAVAGAVVRLDAIAALCNFDFAADPKNAMATTYPA